MSHASEKSSTESNLPGIKTTLVQELFDLQMKLTLPAFNLRCAANIINFARIDYGKF